MINTGVQYTITNVIKSARIFLKEIQQLYAIGEYSKSFKQEISFLSRTKYGKKKAEIETEIISRYKRENNPVEAVSLFKQ